MQTYLQHKTPTTFSHRIPDAFVEGNDGIQEESKISNHLALLVIPKE